MRNLFCGDVLPASRSLLKERLPAGEDEIAICDGTNLRQALAKADVVIPMMRILDETLMEAGSFGLVSNGLGARAYGPRCGPRVWHLGGQRAALVVLRVLYFRFIRSCRLRPESRCELALAASA